MSNSIQLDGKGQYLGRIEDVNSLGVYNQGIYNDGIYNFPINLNIANIWTLGFWVRPGASKEFGTIFSVGKQDDKNTIEVFTTSVPEETTKLGKVFAELRVLIKDKDGTTIKHYGWGDWFQQKEWTHTFLQWDGTDLTASKNASVTSTGVVFVDSSGEMGDANRKIFYGSLATGGSATFSGIVGHFGMWNSLLDVVEFGTVVSGGFAADLTVASGNYTSQDNLQHYWKPGEDSGNIGKDFASTANTLDLDKLRDVATGNITTDQP